MNNTKKIILSILIILPFIINCGGGGGSSESELQSVGTEIPADSSSTTSDTGQTASTGGTANSNITNTVSTSIDNPSPQPPAKVWQNPNAAQISVDAPSKPRSLTINLPGMPDPKPEGLIGYEIWRGSASGFVINDDGFGASSGAVKIADSSLNPTIPAGLNLSDTAFVDSGNYMTYSGGNWSNVTGTLPDGTAYSYIVRYKYDKTPENTTDNDFAWSSGVKLDGSSMFFAKPDNLNLFASGKDSVDNYITVRWRNPSDPNPVPDRIKIYRQLTPFVNDDISGAVLKHTIAPFTSDPNNRWQDTSVEKNVGYHYLVQYEYDKPAGSAWDGSHISSGAVNAVASTPGVSEKPANVFATNEADVKIESINGNVGITWLNFPTGTFPPNGKVVILKAPGDVSPTFATEGVEQFTIQYWGFISPTIGTLGTPTNPHPFAGSGIQSGVLSGTSGTGYTYSLDLSDPAKPAFKLANLGDGEYSYAFYVIDDAGNLSDPAYEPGVPCVTPSSNPVTGITLRRDKADAPANLTVSYSKPSLFTDNDRIEIYYSTVSQAASIKGSGTVLKGPSDNYRSNSVLRENAPTGTYYFSVYAVYNNGNGEYSYSNPANSSSGITVAAADTGVKISISQSSTKQPGECATANTYNWNQTVTFTTTLPLSEGEIRYTTNGTEPDYNSTLYNPSSKPVLSTTRGSVTEYKIRAKYFTTDGSGDYKAARQDSLSDENIYKIDYNAYNNRFEVYVKDGSTVVTPNAVDHFTRSADGLAGYVKYTPGCGETFTIYKNSNYRTEKVTDAGIGNSGDYTTIFALPTVLNRQDVLAQVVAGNQTASWDVIDFNASGRNFLGGVGYRTKYFLKIEGSPYISDPAGGDNTDLVINQNVKNTADIYVVYPKLITKAIDMWNRPVITPYLWTKNEPVVQVDVTKKDFFTNNETPADNVKVYFNVQYGEKDKPYRETINTVYWIANSTDWPWKSQPDFTEPAKLQSITGQSLSIINIDPFYNAQWKSNNNITRFNANGDGTDGDYFYKSIAAVSGRAYYQICNPWDETNHIGTKEHYSEINNTTKTGELNTKAFRTVVRFRVSAGGTIGYRNADNYLRSFESDTVSAFNYEGTVSLKGHEVKALDHGTTALTSDMPVNYRSYPIEVYEHYEGWGQDNTLGIKWYQKHGIKWFDTDEAGAKNELTDSRYKNLDETKTKVIVYSHGWQKTGYYEIPVYRGWYRTNDNTTDYASWNSTDGNNEAKEWFVSKWQAEGYNVGFFHWNKMAQGARTLAGVDMPGSAEKKIWYPITNSSDVAGARLMTMFSEEIGADANIGNAMADATRSASVGMIFAQEVIDSMPAGFNPTEVIFAGHSLGNNVVTNGAQKIIARREANNSAFPENRIPTRIDLLDPFWGNNNDNIYSYVSGESVRTYSDVFHSYIRNSIGIPVQWYKTSALTQTTATYNDTNDDFYKKTNYVKFYLGTCDNGYIKTGDTTPRLSGELHGEAPAWFFRSIYRAQDDTSSIFNTIDNNDDTANKSRSEECFVSARSQTGALYNRLNSYRGSESNFQWFEMDKWNNNINRTMNTSDDWFFQRKNYWKAPTFGWQSKDHHMNM